MKREIRFRSWSNEYKRMFNPSEISLDNCNNENYVALMQFTGLKDKNEKRIYEGDIITFKRSIGNWTGQYMTTMHEVVFNQEVFAFVMKYGSSYIKLRKHWGYEYEVIGNIYENDYLIK